MRATLIIARDPFNPMRREMRQVARRRRVRALAPATSAPHIALLNGQPLLRAGWNRKLRDGDHLAFVVLPMGSDEGGSNPLQMLLMIAVMFYAPYLASDLAWGQAAGSAMTVGELGAMTSLYSAGISVAGMALVSALIPPPKPPTPHIAAGLAAPSPTYSLQAQGNAARLEAAIPVQYGRLCAYPDFAAQPYQEYAGNEQYLYQLLCLGQGEFDVEAIRIEDTPIETWDEVTVEVVPPGGTLTLFPGNVATSGEVSGQELIGARDGTYSQTGVTITVSVTGHGLAVGKWVHLNCTSGAGVSDAYQIVSVPTADSFTVTAASQTTSGNVTLTVYLGPFVANAAGTQANMLGIDFVMPRGLYSYDSGSGALSEMQAHYTVERQAIDDEGNGIGAWTSTSGIYSDTTTTPQRRSLRISAAAGRYRVRVRRTDAKDASATVGHELIWAGLRAYLLDTLDYGGVTLIALRMRASNNLSMQASRKINVICTRKLPIWNGSAWSAATTTRSIAWALADACRNTTYGARLPDSRIDLAGLLALDAVWSARGDEFNGRFDNALSLWEAIGRIAAAGRAKPFMQGGVLRIMRDQAQTIPVAMFSMRNILRGSFSVDYLMPTDDTADAVDVSYLDGASWTPRRVTAKLGAGAPTRTVKVDLFGVTSRAQAYREGIYLAACNLYRRRTIKFSTEMEGFIPALGDLIAISHDMPAWGQGGEVVAWDSGTRTLTLSEPVEFTTGTHYLALRARDGSVDGPYVATAGADSYHLTLATWPASAPYTGGGEERAHFVFGPGAAWSQLARVLSVRPRDLHHVEIEAVNEDPAVHTADQGVLTPPVQTSQLGTLYTAPVVAGLFVRASASDPNQALMTWQAAPGADRYLIEMASSNAAGTAWTRVGDTAANNYTATALYGAQTWIRVCAIGLTRGPWVSLLFGSTADYMWSTQTGLMWNANDTTLMWSY